MPGFVQPPGGLPDSVVERPAESRAAAPAWGAGKRFLFRFGFSYLLLYILPFPLSVLPWIGPSLAKPYKALWDAVVPWVGSRVFHVNITILPNGSGDTTYNYVQVFSYLVLALAAALVWTLLDRRRAGYSRLHEWLRVYVRFYLAMTLFSYGIVKVIQLQFPSPPLDRLLQPFGTSSPMGLLWTFMGASALYTLFGGACEVLGGLLLTTRRTTLLGALVSIGVLTNVVMLNFSYDVPVKLFSSHLLAMAVFLAAPDLRRLADLFLFNRPAILPADRPLFARRWSHQGTLVLRTAAVLLVAGSGTLEAYRTSKTDGELAPKPPLYGIWNVDEFVADGQARPPLLTDKLRWQRVIFDFPGFAEVQLMGDLDDDSLRYYPAKLDEKAKVLTLTKGRKDKTKWKSVLSYAQPDPGHLVLEGALDGHPIRTTLHRIDRSRYLLVSRGFHWINERPFNR
jgi:hypothetical protein